MYLALLLKTWDDLLFCNEALSFLFVRYYYRFFFPPSKGLQKIGSGLRDWMVRWITAFLTVAHRIDLVVNVE